jgi:predicted enzyme involved in methoxymalonyl-ACP biosynthesis
LNQWGIGMWYAEYLPTKKNQLVAEFWPSAGFTAKATAADRIVYFRDLSQTEQIETSFIKVIHG